MADQLGASFAPTFDNADLAKRGQVGGQFPQGSLQVLNYRLPSVAGAAGIPGSISPLLGDQRRGGFGSAVLQSVLHTILGPDAGAGLMGGSDDSFAAALRRERGLNAHTDTPNGSQPSEPYPLPTPNAPRAPAQTPFPDGPPPRRDAPPPVVGTKNPDTPGDQPATPAASNPFDTTPDADYSYHAERASRFRGGE